MGVLLDPKKQYVQIDLYYVEEVRPRGNSVFHFMKSEEEMEEWKSKGYRQGAPPKENQQQPAQPGMPVQSTDPHKVIEKLETRWRRLRWKDHNTIYSRCMRNIPTSDGQLRVDMDVIKFRDMKLKTCLKWWNLKGEDGQEIPVNDDNIDNLIPEVAHQLLDNFEKVTEVSEEDVKK